MNYDSMGGLMVRVFTASEAIPLMGVVVNVTGADEENFDIAKSALTDDNGITPVIRLPAPNVRYSLSYDPNERPYATYDVTLIIDGYYTKRILGVQLFSDIVASLPVEMLPFVSNENGGRYPRYNNAILFDEVEK